MSSSSMRKLGQRATHKERGQPLERQKLGLLEKHKDYSLRAKDFNKKKEYLRILRQKAADRNEDEFNHKMLSRRGPGTSITRGKRAFTGRADGNRGNSALSVDFVRLLKTQDMGYLRSMRNVLIKEVRGLEERVAIAASFSGVQEEEEMDDDDDDRDDNDSDAGGRPSAAKRRKPNKVIFSTDADERDAVMGDNNPGRPGRQGGDDDNSDDNRDGAGSSGGLDRDGSDGGERTEAHPNAEKLAKLRRKLKNARLRLRTLTDAENELAVQQAKMAKTATSGGVTKSGKKIKVRERKR